MPDAVRAERAGRPSTEECGSPRTSAVMATRSTAKVVTLMPPAVPALPPPMNIRTQVISSVAGSMAPMSMELKPAVRAMAEWKNPLRTLSGTVWGPRVPGLVHSSRQVSTVPVTSRTAVVMRVSLV